ncbi:Nucleoporin SEH1 [Caenorhabditis elegans]|uniref:Nucleoporin SEH1 n=1 Tax=Caenorhabditis elegans TaxID=6239 RepID=SEH1_CAEEL|nr:Nucleoporin SEH1 [Caenorhabditis elegans]O45933.1 RecName: Full=Nucleoporin SEH1; Short=CeSeh1; AltName: Full=GATOR complex protein SEH1; AltName: Full=Nuclear pore complex protein 18; AltName: Full=SEC13-like protein [Caenorhabditis elegans]CAA16333.1 Nucleoporin SEH1 [Caenorhabditis elegans]|eukprot:NP_499740.1 Nucleoporin SEH1 [Caenorhabditis elegans]
MQEDDSVKPFQTVGAHRDLIHCVSFDPHGRRMATCASDMTMAIWDRKPDGNWRRSAHWKCHGGAVWRVIWAHPEFGQIVATCSYDRTIVIWEEQIVRSEKDLKQKESQWIRRTIISDNRSDVTDICFSPRHLGLMMASCNVLGTVRIYEAPDIVDASRWNLIHELQAFHTRCGCVTWSLSRMHRPLIAVGSDEKKAENKKRVVIYENIDGLRKWQRINSLVFDLPCPITDLKFSPISMVDSHQLAVASGDVHVYNIKVARSAILEEDGVENPIQLADYNLIKVALLGDHRKAWRLRYNLMGSVISSTSLDGTLRSWKSLFVNQWVKLSEMNVDDYVPSPEEVRAFISSKTTERLPSQLEKTYF